MLAISFGAVQIADYLSKNGAKTNLTDNFGRNALQLALLQGYLDQNAKTKLVNRFYATLKGDSVRVKIDNRLIKIDNHQAEFLMINYMIAVLRTHLIKGFERRSYFNRSNPHFQTQNFIDFYEGMSQQVVAEYRRKRPYISSILSKNEINRDDKYNKKLFVRLQQGYYLPNPLLEILVDEEWVNIYDLIDLEDIKQNHDSSGGGVIDMINNFRKQLTENPDAKIDHDKFWQEYRNNWQEKG
jgi:hypothetical protein